MKFTERFLIILMVIGICLRFSSAEGGIFLQAIGSAALAFFYLLFCFFLVNDINYNKMFAKSSYQGITAGNIIRSIVSGFAFAIAVFAVLFKTMGWSGADVLYLVGSALVIIMFTALLIAYLVMKNPADKRLLIRSSVFVAALLVLKVIELTLLRK